jgi:hypothetical protein
LIASKDDLPMTELMKLCRAVWQTNASRNDPKESAFVFTALILAVKVGTIHPDFSAITRLPSENKYNNRTK